MSGEHIRGIPRTYEKEITLADTPYTLSVGFNCVKVDTTGGNVRVNLPDVNYPIDVIKTSSDAYIVTIWVGGTQIGEVAGELSVVTIENAEVTKDEPWYPYDAIVGIAGDEVLAKNKYGKVIARGVAGMDDATVIQSALDSYDKVVLSNATFLLDSSLVMNTYNELEGAGWNTILKLPDGKNNSAYTIIECNNSAISIKIANLQIDGNESNNRGYTILPFAHAIDTTHNNALPFADGVLIEHCYIHDTIGSGVVCRDNVEVTKCKIGNSLADHLIYCSNSKNANIHDNFLYGYGWLELISLSTEATPANAINVRFYNNIIKDIAANPLATDLNCVIDLFTGCQHAKVYSNHIDLGTSKYVKYAPIYIVGGYNEVFSNTINGETSGNSDNYAHVFVSGNYNDIHDNELTGFSGNGIGIRGQYNLVHHNRLIDTVGAECIVVQAFANDTDGSVISDNEIFGHATNDCIRFQNSGLYVVKARVRENTLNGPYSVYHGNVSMTSDIIFENNWSNGIWDVNGNSVYRNNVGYSTESSGSSTGTGSEQTIAHGLDAIPTGCKAWIKIEYPVGSGRYITKDIPYDVTYVYPTVDNGVAFEWGIA